KRLGHRDEVGSRLAEAFHQAGEVQQRAAQAIDLVDDYDVDASLLDVGQKSLKRRTLEVGTGEASVVVALLHQLPAGLPAHVAGAGVPLGVEGRELLVEPV